MAVQQIKVSTCNKAHACNMAHAHACNVKFLPAIIYSFWLSRGYKYLIDHYQKFEVLSKINMHAHLHGL